MSSHHFVKEGQEPALLVVDPISDDHLLSVLEWSPTVLVVEPAMAKVASWGIRVDVIIYDPGAYSQLVMNVAAAPVPAAVEIENSLSATVVSFLRSTGQNAVDVMIDSPGNHLCDWEIPGAQVALLDTTMKWSLAERGRFGKWMPAGSSLFARGNDAIRVSGANAVDASPRDLQYRNDVVINVEQSGIVSLSSPSFFWAGEFHR